MSKCTHISRIVGYPSNPIKSLCSHCKRESATKMGFKEKRFNEWVDFKTHWECINCDKVFCAECNDKLWSHLNGSNTTHEDIWDELEKFSK